MGATILGVLPKMDDADAAQSPQAKQRQTGRRRGAAPPEATARDLIAHDQPLSAVAENFRTIRTNLVFMGGDEKLQVLVITSANPREGKTTIAANLATSLAQSGKRVLVIDTDLRRPRLHRAFRLRNGVGVTTYVAGQATLDEVLHATVVPGVHIIPSGPIPPNPTELLHREKFHELIRHARDRFDVILCDSPPLGAVIDAAVLAPQVDGVVLVARPGETTRQALRTMLRQLRDVGARVVGAIVNGVDPRGRGGYGAGSSYYYYYRRDRYYTSDPEPADDREPRDEDRDPPSAGADA